MYTVTIYDKAKREFRKYHHIEKISYFNVIETVEVTGADLLSHNFQLCFDLRLFSRTASYTVSEKLLGALEIEQEA